MTKKDAEQEIRGYLKDHPVAYPSDIAAELGLDLVLVMETVQDLLARGRVEEID